MTSESFRRLEEPPTADEYMALREVLGWGRISQETARKTLAAATFTLSLRDGDRLAGLVRIVGDGVLYLFIADVMVHPDYAGRGLGNVLMTSAMDYIEQVADPGASVTLIPMTGREGFYERFGFERCPNGLFGAGMAYTRHMSR